MKKVQTTIIFTRKQFDRLKKESEESGNSVNSIVRFALESYWKDSRMLVECSRNPSER